MITKITKKNWVGKFIGADVYQKNNELLFKFLNEDEASCFLNIIMSPVGIGPTPSVTDLMLKERYKRMENSE